MLGYFIYRDVVIAVDLFSQHHNAMKPGEVRVLKEGNVKEQIFEALSGKPWDEAMDRLEREIMSDE